jgi:hypothetical protein
MWYENFSRIAILPFSGPMRQVCWPGRLSWRSGQVITARQTRCHGKDPQRVGESYLVAIDVGYLKGIDLGAATKGSSHRGFHHLIEASYELN